MDQTAQVTAQHCPIVLSAQQVSPPEDLHLTALYKRISGKELEKWEQAEATQANTTWSMPDGRLVLPTHMLPSYLQVLHNPSHPGVTALAQAVSQVFVCSRSTPSGQESCNRVYPLC